MEAARHPWPALGVLLLRDGLVTKEELESILDEQRDARQRITGTRLGEILVERGIVGPLQIARLLAEQYELPFRELAPADVDVRTARALTIEQARRFGAVLIGKRSDGSYDIAIADPSTVVFSDELRSLLGAVPHFAVVGHEAIAEAIDRVYADPASEDADEHAPQEAVVVALRQTEEPESTLPSERTSDLAQPWPPLGALLVRDGFLTDEQLESALAQQRLSTSHRLGEILVGRGVVSPATIARLVAEQYELPFAELSQLDVDPSIARLLPHEVARAYRAVPLSRGDDGSVEVAIADPTSVFHSDELHRELAAPLAFVVAPPDQIDALVEAVYASDRSPDQPAFDDADGDAAAAPIVESRVDIDTTSPASAVDELAEAGDGGAYAAVAADELEEAVDESAETGAPAPSESGELAHAVRRALDTGAQVLHLSSHDGVVDLRARTGGPLDLLGSFPAAELAAVVSRLSDDSELELHSLPTARGTKVTATRRGRPHAPTRLGELGLAPPAEQLLRQALEQPGVVIVTGPAGSGVSTTLYAALEALVRPERAVATVEAEIVRWLDGVDQTELADTGVPTYADAILRHSEMDADVVLVSDLPDAESVLAALRCGLADRHVLAGMTETDASQAAARVRHAVAGSERLGSAVRCIVSQRLVRLVCDTCRETYYASPAELAKLGLDADGGHRLLARGRGCRDCHGTGYRGRTAVFEMLPTTREPGSAPSEDRGVPAAAATIRDGLVRLCLEGLTTTAEVDRLCATLA